MYSPEIEQTMRTLFAVLSERDRRLYAAVEASAIPAQPTLVRGRQSATCYLATGYGNKQGRPTVHYLC